MHGTLLQPESVVWNRWVGGWVGKKEEEEKEVGGWVGGTYP